LARPKYIVLILGGRREVVAVFGQVQQLARPVFPLLFDDSCLFSSPLLSIQHPRKSADWPYSCGAATTPSIAVDYFYHPDYDKLTKETVLPMRGVRVTPANVSQPPPALRETRHYLHLSLNPLQ